jgi:hypothetical protein
MQAQKAKYIDQSQLHVKKWRPQAICSDAGHSVYTYTNLTNLVDLFAQRYSGRCTFVVNVHDNELKLSKQSREDRVASCRNQIGGHAHLAKCDAHTSTCKTYISGEAFFNDGRLYALSNKSGTFRSEAEQTMDYTVFRFYHEAKNNQTNRLYGVIKYTDCKTNEETLFNFE